jgi:hypothetical protein
MANPITSTSTLDNNLTTGGTNSQGLSDWAAPYITNYLNKATALSETPYQAYKGPLTAGPSDIQNKLFSGINSLNFPSNLGQSFSSTGAYQVPQYDANGNVTGGGTTQPGVAAQYMNPYLQSVLNPQLEELRRQSQITQASNAGKMANAGAFGGSRQAIMDSELQRNLMQEQNKTVGTGYANAYDKAMNQFNTEQTQAKTIADLMAEQGKAQRGITSEGVAADQAEFEKQRQYPFQQVQFLRDMVSGLPVSSVSNTPGSLTSMGSFLSSLGGAGAVASAMGYKDVGSLLKKLGLDLGP